MRKADEIGRGVKPLTDRGAARSEDGHWRNQRIIDLLAVVMVLGLIGSGFYILTAGHSAPLKTSFIVPSQTTRW